MGAAAAVAGIGAVAGIAGGVMQAGAASSAADKSIAAQQEADARAQANLDRARADLQPWVGTGGTANTQTADLLGLNGPEAATKAMGQFQTSPGYGFQLSEGLRAVDAGAAAKGMLRSGATLKAEQEYGAGLANQDFSNYYNRLFGLSQLGERAAAGQGEASGAAAKADLATGQGIAGSETTLGAQQASIYGNAAQGIGSAANSYIGNKLYQDRTGAPGGGTTSAPTVYNAQGFGGQYEGQAYYF